MKRAIVIILIFTIVLGTLGVALNLSMGNQTVAYLERYRLETGQFMYKFNVREYIMNLNIAITDTSKLTLALPTRIWQSMNQSTLAAFGLAFGNNLALILDYILFGINILLYPFRIGGYTLRAITGLVGINQDTNNTYNGLAWLINLANWLVERIAIPYI